MLDALNFKLSQMRHNICVGDKLAMMGVCGLLQAVHIYSNVQTQTKLVCIMCKHVYAYQLCVF